MIIGVEDTGVPNTLFTNGCAISDFVGVCHKDAPNHGAFASCVAGLGNTLRYLDFITGAQKSAIQNAAARYE